MLISPLTLVTTTRTKPHAPPPPFPLNVAPPLPPGRANFDLERPLLRRAVRPIPASTCLPLPLGCYELVHHHRALLPVPPTCLLVPHSLAFVFVWEPPPSASAPASYCRQLRVRLPLWFTRTASQPPCAPSDIFGSSCTAPGRRLHRTPQVPDAVSNSGD